MSFMRVGGVRAEVKVTVGSVKGLLSRRMRPGNRRTGGARKAISARQRPVELDHITVFSGKLRESFRRTDRFERIMFSFSKSADRILSLPIQVPISLCAIAFLRPRKPAL